MTVDVMTAEGQPYVPLVKIARSLGLTYRVTPDQALNFTYQGRDVAISAHPIAVISDQFIPLSVHPYWQGSELWVPLDAIQKIFAVQVNWHIHTQEAVFSTVAPER